MIQVNKAQWQIKQLEMGMAEALKLGSSEVWAYVGAVADEVVEYMKKKGHDVTMEDDMWRIQFGTI